MKKIFKIDKKKDQKKGSFRITSVSGSLLCSGLLQKRLEIEASIEEDSITKANEVRTCLTY